MGYSPWGSSFRFVSFRLALALPEELDVLLCCARKRYHDLFPIKGVQMEKEPDLPPVYCNVLYFYCTCKSGGANELTPFPHG